MSKTYLKPIYLLSLMFVLQCACIYGADAQTPGLKIESQRISANLRQRELSHIFNDICLMNDFWYDIDNSLSNFTVSVDFQGLSLEDALRRILSKTNYSLFFSASGVPTGVIVLSQKETNMKTDHEFADKRDDPILDSEDAGTITGQIDDSGAVIITSSQIEQLFELIRESNVEKKDAFFAIPGKPEDLI